MSLMSIVGGAWQAANQPAARAWGMHRAWWGFWWIWVVIAIVILWAIFGFGAGHYRSRRGGPPRGV